MAEQQYTHPTIPAQAPTRTLSEGVSLVLEGGGTRGFFSAGVLEAFLDAGIMFPYIIAVSAGAANVLSYIACQKRRNRLVAEHYVNDPRYVSKRNLLLHGSMFNFDFIFGTIPSKHVALDWDMFRRQDIRFRTGALDCQSGKTLWFEKQDITPECEVTIASCSLPILSKMVHFRGHKLLDGGVRDSIPIEQSLADGNRLHVVVLTQNEGFVKEAFNHNTILKWRYRNYPEVVRALQQRHEAYNRQTALCEQLAREGKAIVIRPEQPLQMKRTETNPEKLLALHDEGLALGARAIAQIEKACAANE